MPENRCSLRRNSTKRHAGLLAVEVALEVEEVGLEQRLLRVLVERRAGDRC